MLTFSLGNCNTLKEEQFAKLVQVKGLLVSGCNIHQTSFTLWGSGISILQNLTV